MHIFARLLEFALLLHGNGCYHSDIKPDNATLVNAEGQDAGVFEMKLIDFGELSSQATVVKGCTPEYYKHPNRQYDNDSGRIIIKSSEERLKTEIFSIIRTI